MALRTIIAILIIFFFAGCRKEQLDDCITSTGPIRTEQRILTGFHSVDLSDRIDLVLDHLAESTVEIEGGRNLLDQIVTEVRDSVLYISNDNRCNWVRSFKPRITVKIPIASVHTLILRGTGNITATDTVRHGIFRIDQWLGIGTAQFTVAVQQIYVGLHTGAGDVKLSGYATDNANYYSGIMGTIDASQLRARVVNINNSGIGDFRCWAEEELNVAIGDAGDVYYRGQPSIINSHITGSGSLYQMD
jgi:hypothetical protein